MGDLGLQVREVTDAPQGSRLEGTAGRSAAYLLVTVLM